MAVRERGHSGAQDVHPSFSVLLQTLPLFALHLTLHRRAGKDAPPTRNV